MNSQNSIGRAVSWSALDVVLRHGIQFAFMLVLARLLTPSDFGILAMLSLFTGVAALFIDGGFSQALIQRKAVSRVDESSIFYFNLIIGAVVAASLCAMAPWIAGFYDQPVLREIIYAMALNLFIGAFGSIHTAILTKCLDFKTIARVGAVATVLSGLVAIIAAVGGMGVWSLVLQTLVTSLLSVILLWKWHPWRPLWGFSMQSIRSYFGFSGHAMLAALMYTIYNNLISLIIGKVYTPQAVGFYIQAHRLQQLPVILMTNIVSRVAFPAFSAANADKARLVRGLRKGLELTVFMSIPVATMLVLQAEPLVLMLYGKQWLGAVPFIEVLGISALLIPIQMINISMLKALGRADLNSILMAIKSLLGLCLILFASSYGILAMVWAFVLSNVINVFINTHYTRRFLGYSLWRQLSDLAPYFVAAVPMVAVILMVQYLVEGRYQIKMPLALGLGGAAYLMVCRLQKLEPVDHLLAVIRLRLGNDGRNS